MMSKSVTQHQAHGSTPSTTASGWTLSCSVSRYLFGYHHIFDPSRGVSPGGLSAACVIASTATLADAWSTAIMVGGESLAREALADKVIQRVYLVDKAGHDAWVI